jgi:ribosome recycling factor
MEKSAAKIHEELGGVRTGKASPQLVEHIRVNAYGTHMQMRELAGITCPEPRLIQIQPWDEKNVDPIRKAIEESALGIMPQVDGRIVRIHIPELSEERRRDLIKMVGKIGEEGRVAVRHNRRDAIDKLKKEKKAGDITEDDRTHGEKEIQKLTDRFIGEIDKMMAAKEKELLTV